MSERKTTKKKAVKRMTAKKGEETIEEKENELIKQSRAVAEEARKAAEEYVTPDGREYNLPPNTPNLSLIHISEPTRPY